MISPYITVSTTASSRVIRQTFQALIKSKSILGGYKIPYAKSYFPDDTARTLTKNIQILMMIPGPTRDKSGEQILNNILKNWNIVVL